MRKLISIVLLLCFILIASLGCSKSTNSEIYENVAKKCLIEMYTYEGADKILDENDLMNETDKAIEKLSKYMTEEEALHGVIATRYAFLSIWAGFNNKSKIAVKDMSLKYYKEITDTGAMVYEYKVIINSTPFKEGSIREFELNGQIQVAKEGNDYKVSLIAPTEDKKWYNFAKGRGSN